jgi:large subunit ribosomal protein L15
MRIHDLKISRQYRRLRRGRGWGSGRGAKSGRGQKGQKARSGGRLRLGFEGGRTTLVKKIPKLRGIGYKNPRPQRRQFFMESVSLERLIKVFKKGDLVTPQTLYQHGLIRTRRGGAKIIGNGKCPALRFYNVHFSASARTAVEAAGGEIKTIKTITSQSK